MAWLSVNLRGWWLTEGCRWISAMGPSQGLEGDLICNFPSRPGTYMSLWDQQPNMMMLQLWVLDISKCLPQSKHTGFVLQETDGIAEIQEFPYLFHHSEPKIPRKINLWALAKHQGPANGAFRNRSCVHGALHAHGWLGEPLVPLTTERIQDLVWLESDLAAATGESGNNLIELTSLIWYLGVSETGGIPATVWPV